MSTAPVEYTLKPDSVSVITYDKDGVPESFVLHSSHQTFKPLVRALKAKNWKRVPALVTVARSVADQTEGLVQVKADGIYYKGEKVDNSLSRRIEEIIKRNQPVRAMLRFMNNLYENPEPFAIKELYDWLNHCNLPITDDGCFMAYKRVRHDYKDCYTGTIDNSPGQIIFMERKDVNPDRHQTCSRGLHFCSVAYLSNYEGSRIMKLKINPRDVVSIPTDYGYTKGRTWKYEVIDEVPQDQISTLLQKHEDLEEFQTAVYSIAKEHRKLLADTVALPAIKRLMRRYEQSLKRHKGNKNKVQTPGFVPTYENIRKMPYGRLAKLYKKFYTPEPTVLDALKPEENRMKPIREAYKLTRGQVAEAMGVSYKFLYGLETARAVGQEWIDKFIEAIIKLANLGNSQRTAVSYPKQTMPRGTAILATPAPEPEEDDVDEYGYGYEEYEEENE